MSCPIQRFTPHIWSRQRLVAVWFLIRLNRSLQPVNKLGICWTLMRVLFEMFIGPVIIQQPCQPAVIFVPRLCHLALETIMLDHIHMSLGCPPDFRVCLLAVTAVPWELAISNHDLFQVMCHRVATPFTHSAHMVFRVIKLLRGPPSGYRHFGSRHCRCSLRISKKLT